MFSDKDFLYGHSVEFKDSDDNRHSGKVMVISPGGLTIHNAETDWRWGYVPFADVLKNLSTNPGYSSPKEVTYELGETIKYMNFAGFILTGTIAHIGAVSLSVNNSHNGAWHNIPYSDVVAKVKEDSSTKSPKKKASLQEEDVYNGIADYRDAYIDVVKFNQSNLAQVMVDIALETGNEELFKQYSQELTA